MNKEILFPPIGVLRAIFFYVGQGESTLLIVPDGQVGHQYILVDANFDEKENGDIINLLNQLENNSLIFVNTHPHNDHLRGVSNIKDVIKEIWHSGHIPSKKYGEYFQELNDVITKVGENNSFYLRGSGDLNVLHKNRDEVSKIVKKIGDVDFQVFAPAKYVSDDIGEEDPEIRRARIHEQCGIIAFSYHENRILLTGDSDKTAWKEYITDYHGENLKSTLLSASHHGSRSFFKDGSDDVEIYEDHIKIISPGYLVISAPKKCDSPHGHPHEDAMAIYKKYIDEENIFYLGNNEKSLIVDVDANGILNINYEDGYVDESDVLFTVSGDLTRPYLPQ